MPLNAQISLSIVSHESSTDELSSQIRVTPATYGLVLTNGTGANQCQLAFSDSAMVQDGNESSYTFSAMVDDRGVVSMTAVKVIYFKNTGSVSLDIGKNASWTTGPFAAERGCVVPAGGCVVLVAPTAAGWSTSEAGAALSVFNDGESSGTYDILLVGEGTIS